MPVYKVNVYSIVPGIVGTLVFPGLQQGHKGKMKMTAK